MPSIKQLFLLAALLVHSLVNSQTSYINQVSTSCTRELQNTDFIHLGGNELKRTSFDGTNIWKKRIAEGAIAIIINGNCIQQTTDGGFIIVGNTQNGPADGNIALIKTDGLGNVQWSKTFGAGNGLYENGEWVEQTNDGGFILCGSSDGNVYVIKTDAVGNLMWDKRIATTDYSRAANIKQTSDGGYILTGNEVREFMGLPGVRMLLIKMDNAGNVSWEYKYRPTGNIAPASAGKEVWETPTGYIVCGYEAMEVPGAPSQAFLMKADFSGEVLNYQTYASSTLPRYGFYSMHMTTDGGYIATGGGGYDLEEGEPAIVKTDANLTMQWTRSYFRGFQGILRSIRQTADLGYSFTGEYAHYKTNQQGLISCVSAGEIIMTNGTIIKEAITTIKTNVGLVFASNFQTIDIADFPFIECQSFSFQLNLSAQDIKCKGESTGSVTAIPVSNDGPFLYTWSPGGGNTQTVNNLPSGVYTVTVTDINGTTSTGSVTINDMATNVLTVNIQGSTEVCMGESVVLTAVAAGGTPNYSYVWSNNQNGNSINVTPTLTMSYSVVVTDAFGCSAETEHLVTINELPVVAFTSDETAGCGPLCITFTNTTNNTQHLIWEFGDGSPVNTASPAEHCYTAAGSYNVSLTVTDGNGCSNTHTENNFITVHPDPVASFSVSPETTTILNPEINFTDMSQGVTTWSWVFDDRVNATSTLQHPTYLYNDTGKYIAQLIVTNSFGCKDTAEQVVYIKADYILYTPNTFTPNGDGNNEVFIPLGIGIDISQYRFWIFDRWGNLIFESRSPEIGWDGRANGGKDIAQIDTYVWRIALDDILQQHHEYIGHVNLIR